MSDNTNVDENLPLVYRLLLKVPRLKVEFFSVRFDGVFWAVLLPIMVAGYNFLNLVLLVFLPFPFNYVSVAIGASLIILLVLRIFLERALNTKRAIMGETQFRWDIDEALEHYLHLQKEEDDKNSENKTN